MMSPRAEDLPQHVVGVHGVPRSGTSWLGQIFNSSPRVLYRFQPLFSYAFKDRVRADSREEEVRAFVLDLMRTTDPFVLRAEGLSGDGDLGFEKAPAPTHLVMKHVRYHHLLKKLLATLPAFRGIGLVRHPCAVMNSWLRAPREFKPEWDPLAEWRRAPGKNRDRPEEFNGFEKWREATRLFAELERQFPGRFRRVAYARLLAEPLETVRDLFSFCDLPVEQQTIDFLRLSTTRGASDVNDPYSVFRAKRADESWKFELDERIAAAILSEVDDADCRPFLDT